MCERESDAALFGSRFCALSVLSKNHVFWNATNQYQYPVPPKFFGADSQSSSYRSRKHNKFGCAGGFAMSKFRRLLLQYVARSVVIR